MAHGKHRAVCRTHYLLGRAAEQQVGHPAFAVSAHHDQIGILFFGCLDDLQLGVQSPDNELFHLQVFVLFILDRSVDQLFRLKMKLVGKFLSVLFHP